MHRLIVLIALLSSCTYYQAAYGAEPLTRAEPIVRMVLQEANNEPFDGLVAVAGTALDRVADSRWPATEHGVVYQPYQYSGMALRLGSYTNYQIAVARIAVGLARFGIRPCGPGLFWYHTLLIRPAWSKNLDVACVIGNHIFYKDE